MDRFVLNPEVKRAPPAFTDVGSILTGLLYSLSIFGYVKTLASKEVKFYSSTGSKLALLFVLLPFILSVSGRAFHNLFLHPLRTFPGPRLWIAFPILGNISALRGLRDARIRHFHTIYGDVVRVGANELSFITAPAWKDIYASGRGATQLPKWNFQDTTAARDIIRGNYQDHARFRKSMSHAFSDKALRDQEPLMKVYVDQLISRLKPFAVSREPIDILKWYNLTTFDLIGDLTFGEPFDGLKNGDYHFWVSTMFNHIHFSLLILISLEYPLVIKLLTRLIPASVSKAREEHGRYTRALVMRRIGSEKMHGRPDFMDAMLKHKGDKDELTDDELVTNAMVLVVAGSETTATLLSGATYWLLKTPEALRKVTEEVRGAFAKDDDINFVEATARLPYMLACLKEGFRMYPPVPVAVQRVTLPGAPTEISGYQVPPGTRVGVHQSAAYIAASNFHLPHHFIPERWLPEATRNPSSPFYNDNRAVLQPFSVGPRNCIGHNLAYNEIRLILSRLLWNFDLELCEESSAWHVQKAFQFWEKPALMCRLAVRK